MAASPVQHCVLSCRDCAQEKQKEHHARQLHEGKCDLVNVQCGGRPLLEGNARQVTTARETGQPPTRHMEARMAVAVVAALTTCVSALPTSVSSASPVRPGSSAQYVLLQRGDDNEVRARLRSSIHRVRLVRCCCQCG